MAIYLQYEKLKGEVIWHTTTTDQQLKSGGSGVSFTAPTITVT